MSTAYVLPVRVTYLRRGDEDAWSSSSKLRKPLATDIIGVVAHTTFRWAEDAPDSERRRHVNVFMDVTRFIQDDRLAAPGPIVDALRAQAIGLADAWMKSIRPRATFSHEADDE